MQEQRGGFVVLVQEFDRTQVCGVFERQEEAEGVARAHTEETGRGAWVVASVVAFDSGAGAECDSDGSVRSRSYWVYEGGWFIRSNGRTWYELNELTYRKFGEPVTFHEVRRTNGYVELYDEARQVAVRLHDEDSEVRVSARTDAPWEPLY